jgi:hypothetical protein
MPLQIGLALQMLAQIPPKAIDYKCKSNRRAIETETKYFARYDNWYSIENIFVLNKF